jgi:hypothetical protein
MIVHQFINHLSNLFDREHRRGVSVQKRCSIEQVAVSGQGRVNGQALNENMRRAVGSQFHGKSADVTGTQTISVDHDRHFDTAVVGKISDEARIADVTMDKRGFVGYFRAHNRSAEFVAFLDFETFTGQKPAPGFLKFAQAAHDLVLEIVDWNEISFHLVVILYEVRRVLSIVAAGFADEPPELAKELEAAFAALPGGTALTDTIVFIGGSVEVKPLRHSRFKASARLALTFRDYRLGASTVV